MDSLYSWSLLLALVSGAVGTLLGVLALLQSVPKAHSPGRHRHPVARLASTRIASGVITLGGISLTVSVLVHGRWGHGPASADSMNLSAFTSAHPSFVVAGSLIVLGWALRAYAKRRARRTV